MKKIIVYCLLFIVYCLLLLFPPPAFAQVTCTTDTGCGAYLLCKRGGICVSCTILGNPYGTCTQDSDCGNGFCGISQNCYSCLQSVGGSCLGINECAGGICAYIGIPSGIGRCVSCSNPTQSVTACTLDSQCGSGNICGINNNCYSCTGGGTSGTSIAANISLPAPTGSITSSTGLPAQIVTKFLPAVILVLGFLAVFYIVFAGIRFIISQGDPERVAEARSRLTYAIVGFIVLLLAFAATQLIDRLFLNSGAI